MAETPQSQIFNDVGEYDFKPIIYPRQIILGKVPAKSNCYKIIKLPGKPAPVDCPDCGGFKTVPKCKTCEGMGIVYLGTGEHYSLGKTTVLQKYEKSFAYQCMKYRNKMIDGEITLHMDVYFETKASDLDNSLKIVLDCLASPKVGVKAIVNDNRIEHLDIHKHKDKLNPRIEFHLSVMPAPMKKTKAKVKKVVDIKHIIPSQEIF
jgi:Holliday junction resolvase RusA-like endonuclease/predicted RNA-binding Zn-ribbon protein involved in translation (DUF1610 family)